MQVARCDGNRRNGRGGTAAPGAHHLKGVLTGPTRCLFSFSPHIEDAAQGIPQH
jgi:hypothetical protein